MAVPNYSNATKEHQQMYLSNKYTTWYYRIINSAKNRNISDRKTANTILGYSERHHIIPVSLGGENNKDNLVFLTAKEHFTCHHLLIYMVEGVTRYKMVKALDRMTSGNSKQQRIKITSRLYEYIRPLAANAHSKLISGTQLGQNNPFYGKTHTMETKAKISAAQIASRKNSPRVTTEETKQKLSKALRGLKRTNKTKQAIKESWVLTHDKRSGKNSALYGTTPSEETREKMKSSAKERWTDEYKEKFKESVKNRNNKYKFTCPHCKREISGSWNLQQHTSKCSTTLDK